MSEVLKGLVMILGTVTLAAAPRLEFHNLPELPRPISGQFAGVSGGALLVAGGSYFPVSVFEGGKKVWANSVFVLEKRSNKWQTAELGRPLAYGGSVTTLEGVILIGGSDADRHYRTVERVSWVNGGVKHEALPDLPGPVANTSAALLDGVIYVAGGQAAPTSTGALRNLWALDLKAAHPHWTELDPIPGPGRILPVLAAQNGALYLFSGAELLPEDKGQPTRRYLKDVYSYRPGTGWSKLPDSPYPMVAGPAVAWNKDLILIFGGDDGLNAGRIWELKDKHPGFHREVLAYDTKSHNWATAGTLPLSLVTTTPVVWNGQIIIPGGEARPGHRSGRVLAVSVVTTK
jgi:N-acetylneuraminic acid mutarotase